MCKMAKSTIQIEPIDVPTRILTVAVEKISTKLIILYIY